MSAEAVSIPELFGFKVPFEVEPCPEEAVSGLTDHVPVADEAYHFEPDVSGAILAGFANNRRVLLQGGHGSGKSTHIEQIAARLGWPCLRVNLDGHLTRIDLIGRDTIVVRDGVQITEFAEGILPWALQRPMALVFDEYDAGRPDVMFVIHRVLERDGRLTLLDQNGSSPPTPSSDSSPPPTPSGSATPAACTGAPRSSTRPSSIAGTSWPGSTTWTGPTSSR